MDALLSDYATTSSQEGSTPRRPSTQPGVRVSPLHLAAADAAMHEENQAYDRYVHRQQDVPTTRSSPIAIARIPTEVAPFGMPQQRVYSDDDDDDDDDDDEDDAMGNHGMSMVERDAQKLRKKYGNRVVASTYDPRLLRSLPHPQYTPSSLRAPYLGALRRSADCLLNLPPMSLSSAEAAAAAVYANDMSSSEAPERISYGSLRDSQQRGRFLDGPSSYREPRSGQIRKLNAPASTGSNSSGGDGGGGGLSIGERMSQSRRRREENQKQPKTKAEETSSLSLMMQEASKQQQPEEDEDPEQVDVDPVGIESLVPINDGQFPDNPTPALGELSDRYDPPNMLSTSLTAFEVLMSSNQTVPQSTMTATTTAAQQQPQQREQPLPRDLQSGGNILVHSPSFLPLSRTMSDPNPQSPPLQSLSLVAATTATAATTTTPSQWTPYSALSSTPGLEPSPLHLSSQPSAAATATNEYGDPATAAAAEEDPGAFGDLDDME